MKIMWVAPRMIGPATRITGTDYNGTSGSWIQSEYDNFKNAGNEITYLCGSRSVNAGEVKRYEKDGEKLFCVNLPKIAYGFFPSKKLVSLIKDVIDEVNPDIIHIWGTETCIQAAVVEAAENIPKLVYIQGLIGMHNRYRGGYMAKSDPDYLRHLGIRRRIIRQINDMRFKKQIKIEQFIISKCRNVVCDNNFIKGYCYSFDKDLNYYTRFLSASDVFKNSEWSLEKCKRHSLFTVFGSSAEKGIHQLLKAINILKEEFPDITVHIPGNYSIGDGGHLKSAKSASSFEKWMSSYIEKHNLRDNVFFVGAKSPKGMVEELLDCNVFVNPSCMEVHALSLREAMTVGVPCISSLCGSVAEYMNHGKNGFIYRYEEYEILAYYIKILFENDDICKSIGHKAKVDIDNKCKNLSDMTLEKIYEVVTVGNSKC